MAIPFLFRKKSSSFSRLLTSFSSSPPLLSSRIPKNLCSRSWDAETEFNLPVFTRFLRRTEEQEALIENLKKDQAISARTALVLQREILEMREQAKSKEMDNLIEELRRFRYFTYAFAFFAALAPSYWLTRDLIIYLKTAEGQEAFQGFLDTISRIFLIFNKKAEEECSKKEEEEERGTKGTKEEKDQ